MGRTNLPDFRRQRHQSQHCLPGAPAMAYDAVLQPRRFVEARTVTAVTSNFAVLGNGTDCGQLDTDARMTTSAVVGVFPTRGLCRVSAGIAPVWTGCSTTPAPSRAM